MRRRALLWLAGLALIALALLLTDRLLWRPGLTEDNVRRLRPGMTLAEVEALLGGPATEAIDWQAEGGPLAQMGIRWQQHWRAEGAAVDVQFFADGTVMAAAEGGLSRPGVAAKERLASRPWRAIGEVGPGNCARLVATDEGRSEGFHVKTESGTQVASRGPPWRSATPPV